MEGIIRQNAEKGIVPSLLLHSCCAPCSSFVIECLSRHFRITVFYYNPNLYPDEEYKKREAEQIRFLTEFPAEYPVDFLRGAFEKDRFLEAAAGLEGEPEGGMRCMRCYRLRLAETAKAAKQMQADYFTTTLSVSPHKNAEKLNEIGEALAAEYGISYLVSDFKKKNGCRRSVELSGEYGLYRQDYCGCIFSMHKRQKEKEGRR